MIGDKHKIQPVVLALGGNLGRVEDKFRFAIRNLSRGGFEVTGSSSVYLTRPEDCAPDAADFLNMVVSGFYSGTPEELLRLIKDIEAAAGRPAIHGVNTARVLDIDIIFFGDATVELPGLIIPHPRWKERLFVLMPLAELCGSRQCPGEECTIDEFIREFIAVRRLNPADYIALRGELA